MAMRAGLKKIYPSNIYTRFLEGRQLVPPYLGSIICRDRRCHLNTKEVKIEENWGKSKKNPAEFLNDHIVCLQKLESYLHLAGPKSRPLLSIKTDDRIFSADHTVIGGCIQFTTTPYTYDIGLQRTTLLELSCTNPYGLPRQAVEGLVCITTMDKEAFFMYNPSTGSKSDLIKTTACYQETKYGERRRKVDCIAFGYDTRIHKHKVVCVSSTLKKKASGITAAERDAADSIVVEVLTIDNNVWKGGEYTWRRLYDNLIRYACWEDGLRFQLVDPPVYVNGSIYWLLRRRGHRGMLVEFVLEKEEFRYPSLHPFVADSKEGPLETVQLMEFDGCVGILKRISKCEASAQILMKWPERHDDWLEETISLPCAWTVDMDYFPIEALTGTNKMLIQSSDSVFCYNRNTKESKRFPILDGRQRIMQL